MLDDSNKRNNVYGGGVHDVMCNAVEIFTERIHVYLHLSNTGDYADKG